MKDLPKDLMNIKEIVNKMNNLMRPQEEDKVYFSPGQLVQLRQDLPNKPIMLVVRKENSIMKYNRENKDVLKGIKCRWFTKDGFLQEATFNTKDLILIK